LRTSATSSSVSRNADRWGIRLSLAWITLVIVSPHVHAGDGRITVLLKGNLTTSSQIFINPNAADIPARGESLNLTDFFGVGGELKYRIPETNIAIGISADYIRARLSSAITAYPRKSIPIEDGYVVVPVELTGYFIIPVSGETLGIFMGGGGGLYFGKRTYTLGGSEAVASDMKPGFGIHVLGGISYRFYGPLEAVFEMKFRDLQFETENAFTSSTVRYNGTVVNVSTQPFKGRTQTDGIVFQLGLAFSF